ncbi:Helicase IV [Mycobacterium sp. THAF192]|nr:Helicase IV [Mycobacterium sp. THAF192]
MARKQEYKRGKMPSSQPSPDQAFVHADQAPAKRIEVEKERRVEARYRERVADEARHPAQPDGPRNGRWTGSQVRAVKDAPFVQLEGRVALRKPSLELGGITEFYVGRKYSRIDGIDVINWRSPLGQLFFDGGLQNSSSDGLNGRGAEELKTLVAAIRTFDHSGDVLINFVDDVLCEPAPQPLFGRPKLMPQSKETSEVTTRVDPAEYRQESRFERQPQPAKVYRNHQEFTHASSQGFVRAEPLLLEQLRAPRPKALAPVLSTLQPEQYRLITATHMKSMIIEGGPGTGKSIIASHRASYFVSAEADFGLEGDVLVVGPTPRYTKYIEGVITELTGGSPQVTVASLEELFAMPVALPSADSPASAKVDRLDHLIVSASAQLANGHQTRLTVAQVYEYLRRNGTEKRPLSMDPKWLDFRSTLPPYSKALSVSPYSVVLSRIERLLAGSLWDPNTSGELQVDAIVDATEARISAQQSRTYRHIIVDEAQDVTVTEWLKLRNLISVGAWTILGDFNQRRADKTPKDWSDIVKALDLPINTPRCALTRGYRSTTQIIEFASRLLPSTEEPPSALRPDGEPPLILNPIREHVARVVVRQIDRLVDQHSGGTIAVITTMPGPILKLMKESVERPNVVVLPPNHSRGLEFDGVIVVEPADFPKNDHRRHGLLYTALTRPNKELVIVHSKELPLPLRESQRTAPRRAPVAPVLKQRPKNKRTRRSGDLRTRRARKSSGNRKQS